MHIRISMGFTPPLDGFFSVCVCKTIDSFLEILMFFILFLTCCSSGSRRDLNLVILHVSVYLSSERQNIV